ncbi:MAG: hypothetical protein WC552_09025, partial [Candidatus Omnitrophota bacterium]
MIINKISAWRKVCACVVFLSLSPLCSTAAAQLNINLVAVNASDAVKAVPVKYYLPKELEPEAILDVGGLKMDYDVDKGAYFVYGNVEFQPKETKIFKVKVKDVWRIQEGEIDILKKQLEDNLDLMKGHPDYDNIVKAKDQLQNQLDYIYAQQVNYSDNIERRIEEYRAYKGELEEIRKKTFHVEYIQHEAKSIGELAEARTIKFLIEVVNPSKTQEKTVQQKHYLPKEIRKEDVVDPKGFDVRYDAEKEKVFLSKEEKFLPAETKKYEIAIRDIWRLPLGKVSALEERAQLAHKEISESAYAEAGEYLFKRVVDNVNLIRQSQKDGLSIKEHIGVFRTNEERYKAADDDVTKLEQMLSVVRAKKLEELEKGKVKNVLQRLKALRGLAALSEAVFKKKISRTMTWRIIIATLAFLAF